jgi:predicted Zn-dependent protease
VGDVQAARTEILILLETDPHNIAALRMMASIEHHSNNPEQTIVWLRRAVAVQPGDVALLVWLANMLIFTGALTDAQQVAGEALLSDPNSVLPLRVLADIAQRRGNVPDAISALRRAVLVAPGDLHMRISLTRLLMQADALAEARLEAERILEVEPANIGVLYCMADIARRTNRTDEVAKWARAVVAAPSAVPENLEWATWRLIEAGDLGAARDVALSILGHDPSHAGALRCLADIGSLAGR